MQKTILNSQAPFTSSVHSQFNLLNYGKKYSMEVHMHRCIIDLHNINFLTREFHDHRIILDEFEQNSDCKSTYVVDFD